MAACRHEHLGSLEAFGHLRRIAIWYRFLELRQVVSLLFLDVLAQHVPERLDGRFELFVRGRQPLELVQEFFDLYSASA